jgi:gentisate 1,2-dioxygenase
MKYYEKVDINYDSNSKMFGCKMLDEKNGCKNGVATGITIYKTLDYLAPGIHDDQEGFAVLSGSGYAKIGEQEFKLEKEMSFIAPAGIAHSIKSDNLNDPIKVFWFHAAL